MINSVIVDMHCTVEVLDLYANCKSSVSKQDS